METSTYMFAFGFVCMVAASALASLGVKLALRSYKPTIYSFSTKAAVICAAGEIFIQLSVAALVFMALANYFVTSDKAVSRLFLQFFLAAGLFTAVLGVVPNLLLTTSPRTEAAALRPRMVLRAGLLSVITPILLSLTLALLVFQRVP